MDQVRRDHLAQYIWHPDWPWERLTREARERCESYVDHVPGAWTRVRIEVCGDSARLFVHGQAQPTLVDNDVKSGPGARGAIGLWIGPGTVAHFRDLRITAPRRRAGMAQEARRRAGGGRLRGHARPSLPVEPCPTTSRC